jgi:hypothetical protein
MTEIIYQNGNFWVCRATFGTGRIRAKTNGFKIFQNSITHAVFRADIGYSGEDGLNCAIELCDKFASQYDQAKRDTRR